MRGATMYQQQQPHSHAYPPMQNRRPFPPPAPAANGRFTIRSGQKTPVRLHHPATHNHIGEAMYAHYINQTEIRFELIKNPGKCLRVTGEKTHSHTSRTSTIREREKEHMHQLPTHHTFFSQNMTKHNRIGSRRVFRRARRMFPFSLRAHTARSFVLDMRGSLG